LEAPVLEIQNLTKTYGRITAISDLSLKVFPGEICGILGPNGSGKTTTLGILLDILKADRGGYIWFGEHPTASQRRKIGSLLEMPIFYPHLSAVNNLKIIADIKETSYNKIDELLSVVGLIERKKSKYKTYSLGMKQRLAIAAALIGDPRVLILDEPTNGLDPKGIAEMRDLITTIGKQGITIILASHLLDEVQKICTHVVVLNKGKKLGSGKVSDVLNTSPAIELAANDMEKLEAAAIQSGFFNSVKKENDLLVATMDRELKQEDLNKYLADKGIFLTHISMRKKSLEKYFLDLTSGDDD
jgi:ABC-2 type transport system ATP-binding protein